MPRYFFHIRESDNFVQDEVGMVFEDLESAKHEARESCRELVIERLKDREKFSGLKVVIADANGNTLAVVTAGLNIE
jgi:hypothetical protein